MGSSADSTSSAIGSSEILGAMKWVGGREATISALGAGRSSFPVNEDNGRNCVGECVVPSGTGSRQNIYNFFDFFY